MCTGNRKTLAATATALAGFLMPAVAFSSSPNVAVTVQFLSPDSVVLSADYRIDPEEPTFFVVHGFRDNGTSPPCLRQSSAIRRWRPGANVIVVDWRVLPAPRSASMISNISCLKWLDTVGSEITSLPSQYDRAVEAANQVGKEIARWMKEKGIAPSRTVISGHSLGAQIAAFASNACARPEFFNAPIGIILAADPAGPQFEDKPPAERLDKEDAGQVVVVHATEIWGDENPIGTLDIYVLWPESEQQDGVWEHSQARELVTASFSRSEMSNTDGTPFGANALGFDFSDGKPRNYQADAESVEDLASSVTRDGRGTNSSASRSLVAYGGAN